jgi:hypothetical protein
MPVPLNVVALRGSRRVVIDGAVAQLIQRGTLVDLAEQPLRANSVSRSESPISQNIGGHRPTNKARRSALPRSSWSTVLARIHKPMHSPIDPRAAA